MPTAAYKPFVRPQADWMPYTQPEPPGASFQYVLKQDEVPGLTLGHVTLTGPIHKTPATHTEWEQVYLILAGSGTVHLAGTSTKISGPGVVVIPKHTHHSVELAAGESLKYVYINQHR
jgi:mannose-6-phosphate isomerase-like protein (cupin superfamily)